MLTFRGGIKPIAHKYTKDSESVLLPSPEYVTIFTENDEVCVNVGDTVKIGDKLTVNHKAHSSVSGTVTEINNNLISVESDGQNELSDKIRPFHKKLSEAKFDEIISYTRRKGICFGEKWLSDKLSEAKDKAKILIVSCGETAPFLCSSYRTLCEKKKEILYGAKIVMKALNINKTAITFESTNKKEVTEFNKLISNSNSFEIVTHSNKYPFDHPEVIKRAFNKKYIHSSEKSNLSDILVLTGNEVSALYEAFKTGIPMVSKLITVDGDAVLSPGNVSVPIGTPISEILKFCNVDTNSVNELVAGNPISTVRISHCGFIQKSTDALIALSSKYVSYHPDECISCGKCHAVCPMRLYPDRMLEKGKYSEKCIKCGCCSYICPSRLDFNSVFEAEVGTNE